MAVARSTPESVRFSGYLPSGLPRPQISTWLCLLFRGYPPIVGGQATPKRKNNVLDMNCALLFCGGFPPKVTNPSGMFLGHPSAPQDVSESWAVSRAPTPWRAASPCAPHLASDVSKWQTLLAGPQIPCYKLNFWWAQWNPHKTPKRNIGLRGFVSLWLNNMIPS